MRPLRIIPLVALGVALACSDSPTRADGDPLGKRTPIDKTGDLVQTLTLDPSRPRSGENVRIRSVIENRGDKSVQLSSRICGLDLEGTLELGWPPDVLKCAGYSSRQSLAPGDSIVDVDIMRVTSPAGGYVLKVRHSLDPEAWIELDVKVREH